MLILGALSASASAAAAPTAFAIAACGVFARWSGGDPLICRQCLRRNFRCRFVVAVRYLLWALWLSALTTLVTFISIRTLTALGTVARATFASISVSTAIAVAVAGRLDANGRGGLRRVYLA